MIENYDHGKHYDKMVDWLAHKGMAKPDPSFFPDVGYCVDGNAIGFLLKTNSRQCFVDQVAANPHAAPGERLRALNTLFELLEEKAKEAGCGLIASFTEIPRMKEEFLAHGYRALPRVVVFLKHFKGVPKCHS